MEWTSPWVIGPLCTGLGVLVGMLIMVALGKDSGSARALVELQEEFESYRGNVNEHFETTSELFQDMTEKYRDVYNHLATGAQEFGSNTDTPPRLEIVRPAEALTAGAAAAGLDESEPADAGEADADSVTRGDADSSALTAASDDQPDSADATTDRADGEDVPRDDASADVEARDSGIDRRSGGDVLDGEVVAVSGAEDDASTDDADHGDDHGDDDERSARRDADSSTASADERSDADKEKATAPVA